MRIGSAAAGAARGLGAGVAAGTLWWVVETAANLAVGGWVPGPVLGQIAALDLGLGAAAGALVGLALGLLGWRADGVRLALALAVAYGLLRVVAPPGVGAEALFLLAAGAAAALGAGLAGGQPAGVPGFVHLTLVTTAATALGAFALDEWSGEPLSGVRLPLVCAVLPVAGLLVDRAVAVAVPRHGRRLALALVAAGVAAAVWGRPLVRAPLEDRLVTAVPPAGTPDVILVSLDTTRADHLSTYGYERETSPNLTAFAADALRFTQARSTSGWTLPGHASMFTGVYPSRHGARLAGAWLAGQSVDGRRRVAHPLSPDAVTLAEALRDRGYQTAAFVANFSYLYRDFGVAQGFGVYDDAPGLLLRVRPHAARLAQHVVPGFCLKPYRSAPEINAAALAWLDRAPAGRPVFLFLNYMEPHQPWLAPAPHDRWSRELPEAGRLVRKNLYTHAVRDVSHAERAFITANYDGQVAAMDAALGELLGALGARGRYENALVVVTADHGELLGEHGQMGHIGRMLYEGLLHVPLVVKFPAAARARGTSDTPVQLVDVLPTVLAAAGAPLPRGVQGEALPHVTHASLAEEEINPFLVAHYGEAYDRAVRVAYDGPYKLMTTSRGEQMLFDLARDPGENTDIAAREPERVAALRAQIEAVLGGAVSVAAAPQRN
jgi:arylsulfatase A-like enzyme